MNSTHIVRCAILLLVIGLTGRFEGRCLGQTQPAPITGKASSIQEKDTERKRKQRRQFQAQELITAKRNTWIFQSGQPPRIIWRDIEEVRRLDFEGPLRIRWFNARLEEVAVPSEPGRWGAWIEGTAPNGTPLRRSLTFYSPPKNSFIFFAPDIKLSLRHIPESAAVEIWREHEAELSRISTDLLRRTFADSQVSAVVMAGLAESKPLGRPARFVESVDVLNEDYHLTLKLKLQGLKDQVRPLKPPRRRTPPAAILHEGSIREAGMLPDAKAKIDAVCRAWAADTDEPFVTLVARRGVVITHEAFGKDHADKPIDTEYRCWVGSITKTVTAMLYSQFLDQGLIDLDDSVVSVFPDYPKNSPHVPTFRQCFNHTSGLSGHGNFGGVRNPQLENIILNGIDVNEPGVRYAYSGMGYELAAKAMEIVAGKSALRLYDEHLFRPLNFGDVPIGNASSDGQFTAMELGILAQWVANRGSYGKREFISPRTFARLLPEPLRVTQRTGVKDEGIGLHWVRHLKPGSRRNSTRPEDQLFSPRTVGHGSFSGCIFVIDLEHDLVIAQARRQGGPRRGEWSARFFQTIAEVVIRDEAQ
jgi:CubicO group peptidase (beta-lactamase class C family)